MRRISAAPSTDNPMAAVGGGASVAHPNPHIWSNPGIVLPNIVSPSSFSFVLIDTDNIFCSARTAAIMSNDEQVQLRLSIKNFIELIDCQETKIEKRFVSGSTKNRVHFLEGKWKSNGCETTFYSRGSSAHDIVDTALHAHGLQIMADYRRLGLPPGSATLVITTGDGNLHDGRTSFPKLVCAAVEAGMRVKVWAWKNSRSASYLRLKEAFPDYITLCDLDPYFNSIMYFKKHNDVSASDTRVAMPAAPFESCAAKPTPQRTNLKCSYCDYYNWIDSQTCDNCTLPLLLPPVLPPAAPRSHVFVPVPGSKSSDEASGDMCEFPLLLPPKPSVPAAPAQPPGDYCLCFQLCDRVTAGAPPCSGIVNLST